MDAIQRNALIRQLVEDMRDNGGNVAIYGGSMSVAGGPVLFCLAISIGAASLAMERAVRATLSPAAERVRLDIVRDDALPGAPASDRQSSGEKEG